MNRVNISRVEEFGLTELDGTFYGDYDNSSLVERSNYIEIKKALSRYAHIYDVYGGYGTTGIAYDDKKISEKAREAIEEIESSLANYPIYDEDAYCKMEFEGKGEYHKEVLHEMYNRYYSEFYTEENFNQFIFDNRNEYTYFYDHVIYESGGFYINEHEYHESLIEILSKVVYRNENIEVKKFYNGKYSINGNSVELDKVSRMIKTEFYTKQLNAEYISILEMIERGEL